MPLSFLILNGPNLNMLGKREPGIYGKQTLDDIKQLCLEHGKEINVEIDFRQSNHEGELVEWIQQAVGTHQAIIINAGAYTHTSIALHDALRACNLPFIEVHLSNIYAREAFRHHSCLSSIAKAVLCGFGANGYIFAINGLKNML